MTAATATAKTRESGWVGNPDYRIDFEPSPRRVRVTFNGETIADSTAMRLMHEGMIPVYYFPRADVRMDLLRRSELTTYCPYKGDASYYTIGVGGKESENAIWSYEDPYDEMAEIKDYMAFYWGRVDHWYEEDDEIFVHARDPYKRIDVVNSSRSVRVVLGGETVAESTRTRFLYETGFPNRYYIPKDDVRADLLETSEKTSRCPYKGIAVYWSARIGGELHEDVVWSYPDPIPECPKVKDYLCFFNELVDDIFVDGKAVPKVKTPWSRD